MKSGNGKWRVVLRAAGVVSSLAGGVDRYRDVTASTPAYSVDRTRRVSVPLALCGVIALIVLSGWSALAGPIVVKAIPSSGLKLWLRADQGVIEDGSRVSSWQDQSGNNNNAVAMGAAPLTVLANGLNGHPAVHFDGAGGYLGLPDIMAANSVSPARGGELFVVVRVPELSGTGGQPLGLTYFAESGAGGGTLYPDNHGDLTDNFGSASDSLTAVPVVSIAKASLYNISASPSGSMMRLNRVAIAAMRTNEIAFTSTPLLGRDQVGDTFRGDIAEVLVYDHTLSASARRKIEEYLAAKYTLDASAPITPDGLLGQGISSTQVSLAWSWDFTGNEAVQFDVYRSPAGQNDYVKIAITDQSASYVDATVAPNTSYSYEVDAFNSAGSSGTSNPVTVTTPTTGTAVPFSSLCLWLKADSGVSNPLQVWLDQSGLGNNASAPNSGVAPALSNLEMELFNTTGTVWEAEPRSIVQFDSANLALSLPDIMGVSGQNPATAGEAFFVLRSANTIPTDFEGQLLGDFGTTSTTGDSLYPNADGSIIDDFGSNQSHQVGPESGVITDLSLYNVLSQAGEWTMNFNEVPQYTTGTNTFSFPSAPMLGSNTPPTGYTSFRGALVEVMIFNTVLTAAQRSAVEFYLASKYMLPDIDLDGDGLTNAQKYQFLLNPFVPNPDGIPDWLLAELGLNPNSSTNPFNVSRILSSAAPPIVDPTSTTTLPKKNTSSPVITLINPDNAVLVQSVPSVEKKRP